MKTFREWLSGKGKDWDVSGRIMENGYAFYLQKQLGRVPTIKELKAYGDIKRLTTDES